MKKRNFLSGILIILIATIFMVACSKSNNNGMGNNPQVHMKNSVFSNVHLQVNTGTTVTWINDDTVVHTVTADDGSFDSGDMQPGADFNWTFSSTGTFAYHSKHQTGMKGVIVVVNGSSGGGY